MSDKQTKNTAADIAKEVFAAKIEPGTLADMISPDYTENRPIWEVEEYAINPYKELPPLQTWCKMGERPALPKEGLVIFTAKYKQGKSLSAYALAIPLLSGNTFDTLTPSDRPGLVMVFDMEMGATTLTNRVLKQVQVLGDNGTKFIVFNLKPLTIQKRYEVIASMVEKYRPDIVIVDQAAKLVENINDFAECEKAVDWLDKLSIGRSVWTILHENKSNDDNNPTGHIGTCLLKANVEWYSVSKKDGIFTITPKEARDTDTENAACIRFALDSDGRIIDASAIFREAQEREAEGWRNNFRALFGSDKYLRSVELIERIKTQEGLEERAAKTKISKAKDLGVIRKASSEKTAPYELTPVEA